MPRTVSEEQHAARENEILDAAQALIYSVGYAQMTIQDLLDALHISRGALYHYYPSKRAVLEALIARMVEQMMAVLQPLVDDSGMSALPKLEAVFRAAAGWKSERIDLLAALIEAWYSDENALARDKLSRAAREQFRPLLEQVIRQGMAEGQMACDYPDLAGAIALDLLTGLSTDIVASLMDWGRPEEALARIARSTAAYTQAIEGVLGLARGSLAILDPGMFRLWGEALTSRRGL